MKLSNVQPFPYLLLPVFLSSRNRARQWERRDLTRTLLLGGVAAGVCAALFYGAFWLATQLLDYEELGDFLLRIGLSWLFLTFLSFLAFSGVVTALSNLFLSEDLRLLLAAPVSVRRVFYSRFLRTISQASWMVVIFLVPVLVGVGVARCAPCMFYVTALLAVVPFAVIPVAVGTALTVLLVNICPARRARDILMLMGLLFAASIVLLVRFVQPERLLRVESLPDVTDFFTTLQSPMTPMLPSFWAGETLFASLVGRRDLLHAGALWMTAAAFTKLRSLDWIALRLPLSVVRRSLLIKDLKVFLRDVTQWSQLLLLLALVTVYLYNFSVLDLEHIPYMSGVIKNLYAFLNLGLAGLVMATVTVRFVFPAVSAEGAAFWIIRSSPISYRDFLWSKFWTGLVPVLLLSEILTIAANQFLGIDPFLKVLTAAAIFFMSFALVGLATGFGARYPRFLADNATQVAGSAGGVGFMIWAVAFILLTIGLLSWGSSMYLERRSHGLAFPGHQLVLTLACLLAPAILSVTIWWRSMQSGVRALEEMDATPG
jgi:ABC-2 type transport system permease protein